MTELEQQLIELVSIARKTISFAGHTPSCQFKACSCGAVEEFKIYSSEFWRQIHSLENGLKGLQ